MSLTKKDIEEIMALLEGSRFDRLSLEMDGMKLELVRSGAVAVRDSPTPDLSRGREGGTSPDQSPSRSREGPGVGQSKPSRLQETGLLEVKSPLLGVFYRAPKPGEPPFVEVGDRVADDTVIGIIEVMKLMNSARAGVSGEVVEILAINGEMIEHGEVLMLVRPD